MWKKRSKSLIPRHERDFVAGLVGGAVIYSLLKRLFPPRDADEPKHRDAVDTTASEVRDLEPTPRPSLAPVDRSRSQVSEAADQGKTDEP